MANASADNAAKRPKNPKAKKPETPKAEGLETPEAERPEISKAELGTVYNRVMVLLLTFEFQDLALDKETEDIEEEFKRLGYNVDPPYNIPMRRSQRSLQKRMAEFLGRGDPDTPTLMIVYYHGHGGFYSGEDWSGLEMSR